MCEEIKVGEYIRVDNGIILKYDFITKNNDEILLGQKGKAYSFEDEEELEDFVRLRIVKHSKNIIDLIEVGDYVNGYKIYNMEYITYNNRVDLVFTIFKTPIDFTSPYKVIVTWQEKDIKSILTHEMYEQNCYKVGEENE